MDEYRRSSCISFCMMTVSILLAALCSTNAFHVPAIDSYIKAADASNAAAVIAAGEREGRFEDLVRFLEMARKVAGAKERPIDSALAYALAQTKRMSELPTALPIV